MKIRRYFCMLLVLFLLASCGTEAPKVENTGSKAEPPRGESVELHQSQSEEYDGSGENSFEGSDVSEGSDESQPVEEPQPVKPDWDYREMLQLTPGEHKYGGFYEDFERLKILYSTEDLEAVVDDMGWQGEQLDKCTEILFGFDEVFFETNVLATIFCWSGAGFPDFEFEGVRWLSDCENGETNGEVLIREYRPDSLFAEDIYLEYMFVIPLSKAAVEACDHLQVRYLYGMSHEDGHLHIEPVDPLLSQNESSYKKGTPVEVTRWGQIWEGEGTYRYDLRTDVLADDALAEALMVMLETLDYTEEAVCSCETEIDEEDLYFGSFCVNGEYTFFRNIVRCSRGQVQLTGDQIELMHSVREELSKMEVGLFCAYSGVVDCFYLGEEDPFAEDDMVLIEDARQWQTFNQQLYLNDTTRCLRLFDDAETAFETLSLLVYRVATTEDVSYWIRRKMWNVEEDTVQIQLMRDESRNPTGNTEIRYQLVCVPLFKYNLHDGTEITVEID